MVERSADLEEFLKRVEDYDLQRRGNSKVATNGSVNDVNGGYSRESLERARKLLSDNDVIAADQTPKNTYTLDAPQLAYRSAYNYERTFSPKRVTEGSKTYTVSEEDYLLLQRLKAKEKSPPPLPSRDKYKNIDRLSMLLGGSTRAETNATSQPSNNYYSTDLKLTKMEPSLIDVMGPEAPPPIPPKSRSRISRDISEDADLGKNTHKVISSPGSPNKLPRSIGLKASPKKIDLKAELEPPKKDLVLNNENNTHNSESSETSSFPSHLDFLDSVQKNKLDIPEEQPKSIFQTKSSSLNPEGFIHSAAGKSTPPVKPVKPLKLADTPKNFLQRTESGSFISSALKSSSPQSNTPSATQTNFKIPSRPSTESFINSALKTSPPPPATKKTVETVKQPPVRKPALLNKPSSKFEHDESKSEKPEKPAKPTGLAQLRPTTFGGKPKPQVPPKNSELILPKLRHVDSTDPSQNKPKVEPDFTGKLKKAAPPEIPKKKPSFPEALTRLNNLSKPPPSPEHHEDVPEALTKLGRLSRAEPPPKRQEDLPEALTKVGHLSKATPPPKKPEDLPEALTHLEKLNRVNKQPPVPARKISMSEALQKAQELKRQQQQQEQKQSFESQPRDVKGELGDALLAQQSKASRFATSTFSNTGFSRNNNETITLSHNNSTPNTTKADMAGGTDLKSLNHANKSRTKGPKRRIPSSLKR